MIATTYLSHRHSRLHTTMLKAFTASGHSFDLSWPEVRLLDGPFDLGRRFLSDNFNRLWLLFLLGSLISGCFGSRPASLDYLLLRGRSVELFRSDSNTLRAAYRS